MIWVIIIGILSGMISGMGIGGGTILIPALMFFHDMSQQQAQGINLIYFVPTAIVALITHAKNKNIEKKVIWSIVFFGFAGAAGGAFLAVHLKAELLKKCFGGFLLLMGVSEVLKKKSVKNTNKGEKGMDSLAFTRLKERFQNADLEEKIQLYVSTKGLDTEQYKQLLYLYPVQEIQRLEEALQTM